MGRACSSSKHCSGSLGVYMILRALVLYMVFAEFQRVQRPENSASGFGRLYTALGLRV